MLERAYRRLVGVVVRPALEFSPPMSAATTTGPANTAATSVAGPTPDVVIAIGRPEFDRLGAALQAALGPGTTRPDTPARLEAALTDAIAGLGASGRPRVARRPAGLYTPEAWQVQLTDAEPAIETAIRRAIREGVFAA
jgi:hypothetical protein